ncbi:MAG: nucleotidyltransferase domain-containing protein [Candidatus Cloacimonetes bacterium]|nr:nucleotidyltransferase domain-containing protein [Candidatus Cloacimonadota bacterium]
MNQLLIVKDLKKLLLSKFPDYLDKVILFGSQVTGNAREYSDYDILIILKTDYDWKLENKILDVCYDIDLKYDILTDVKLISNKELSTIKGKQPFILNAFEKGLVV